jgi:hypothetical protein
LSEDRIPTHDAVAVKMLYVENGDALAPSEKRTSSI